jgi:hypothetical protein
MRMGRSITRDTLKEVESYPKKEGFLSKGKTI